MKKILILFLITCNSILCQQSKEVFELGIAAFQRGDFVLADSLFIKSIQYGKADHSVRFENYYNCGIVKRELNSQNSAIAYFDTSIYMNPKYFPSYHDRSISYFYNEDYKGCIKSVDEGLKVNGKDLDILVLGAMAALADSSYQKGGVYCSKGKVVQKDARFYSIQALLFLQNGELEKGKKEIKLGKTYFKNNDFILEAELYYLFVTGNISEMKSIALRLGKKYPFLIHELKFKETIDSLLM